MIKDANLKLAIIYNFLGKGLFIPSYEKAKTGDINYVFAPILVLESGNDLLNDKEFSDLESLKNQFLSESVDLDKEKFWEFISDRFFEDDALRMRVVKKWALDFIIPQEFIQSTEKIEVYVYNNGFDLAKPFWGGETPEDFEIEDLVGIEIFTNLKTLVINQALVGFPELLFEYSKNLGFSLKIEKY